ncbi:unnamed protein product [Vitrella brassicaformis CCMP3155]|uniref:Uncharacterized protein n=2 Tax=Vitrella brassicaformis TaxID=1169539 RepID=A0A0G4EHF5_VITBC|nr:unnamed protein product [Vitrella brassicaformis CCMP3155]|eukprot:CEL95328.1 unnamed protein product [Vitrella brassicaformis CCMP3155]
MVFPSWLSLALLYLRPRRAAAELRRTSRPSFILPAPSCYRPEVQPVRVSAGRSRAHLSRLSMARYRTVETEEEETGQVAAGRVRTAPGVINRDGRDFVLDPFTRRPVEVPATNEGQVAVCWPTPTINREREPLRLPLDADYKEVVTAMKAACLAGRQEFRRWVEVNFDMLGTDLKQLLGTLKLRAQMEDQLDIAREYRDLRYMYMLEEERLAGPLKQMIKDAELRLRDGIAVGSTFKPEFVSGEYNVEDLAGVTGAEVAAFWVVAKACLAEWENKRRDTIDVAILQKKITNEDLQERTPEELGEMMPTLRESLYITYAFGQLNQKVTNSPAIISELPPELRFLEVALRLGTFVEIRKVAHLQFCPTFNMDTVELRARLRRLVHIMEGLPKQYKLLTKRLSDIYRALADCTPEYEGQGYFQRAWPEIKFKAYKLKPGKSLFFATEEEWWARKKVVQPYTKALDALVPKSIRKPSPLSEKYEETGWYFALWNDQNQTKYAIWDIEELKRKDPNIQALQKELEFEEKIREQAFGVGGEVNEQAAAEAALLEAENPDSPPAPPVALPPSQPRRPDGGEGEGGGVSAPVLEERQPPVSRATSQPPPPAAPRPPQSQATPSSRKVVKRKVAKVVSSSPAAPPRRAEPSALTQGVTSRPGDEFLPQESLAARMVSAGGGDTTDEEANEEAMRARAKKEAARKWREQMRKRTRRAARKKTKKA